MTCLTRSAASVAALSLLLLGSLTARAAIITTPAGLQPGDQFRIFYVTGNVSSATSTDIATYNSTVNTQAGGATYNGATVTWSAIASTSSVSAINNVGVYNVPVYLTTGVLLATSDGTSSGGLWAGTLLAQTNRGITGNNLGVFVWTGTNPDGSKDPNYPLGNNVTFSPQLGVTNEPFTTFGRWVDIGPTGNPNGYNTLQALYGISEVLTVVPEPTTFVLGVLGLLGLGCVALRKKHRRA